MRYRNIGDRYVGSQFKFGSFFRNVVSHSGFTQRPVGLLKGSKQSYESEYANRNRHKRDDGSNYPGPSGALLCGQILLGASGFLGGLYGIVDAFKKVGTINLRTALIRASLCGYGMAVGLGLALLSLFSV